MVEVVIYDIDNGGGHMLLVSNCSMFTFGYCNIFISLGFRLYTTCRFLLCS